MADEQIPVDIKTVGRHTRPTSHRLRSSRQFKRCYDGVRASDSHLLIFAASSDLGHSRAGVSVSKKHGNAVHRNRKKRLLREAFRLVRHDLPAFDFVLVPRQGAPSTLDDYRKSLRQLARRLGRKLSVGESDT